MKMDKTDAAIVLCGTVMAVGISTMSHAKAYIDPSVTTFAIQAIVGVAVAAGAVVTVWWRKARKKINKTLNIDENKGKVVEDEIKEVESDKN